MLLSSMQRCGKVVQKPVDNTVLIWDAYEYLQNDNDWMFKQSSLFIFAKM